MVYDPEYYKKNREKFMERQKRFRNHPKNRERYLQKAREHSKRWYRENEERRREMNKKHWKRQVEKMERVAGRKRPKKCEICKETDIIVFDHCHKTGKFRGWICKRCNIVLGKVKDDKKLLQLLISYLS